MVEMRDREIPFRYIDSGQHAELTRSLRHIFDLREPDVCLSKKTDDIVSITQAARWSAQYLWRSLVSRKWLREEVFPGGGVCLIHGDTLSTLLGMIMARKANLRVAHVESGLRSFRILDPFPEELIRILCMKNSHVLFAPSDEAEENLKNMNISGQIVKVHGNTVVDALRLIEKAPATIPIPEFPFVLATCHRMETIANKKRLGQIIILLNRVAETMPIVFVTHKPTRKYLKRFGLDEKLHSGITQLGMLSYSDFVAMLKAARFVLTDGGSIQEECAYLNKPCLILRKTTERPDGVGNNIVLWSFNEKVAEEFLSQAFLNPPTDSDRLPLPSAKIVDALIQMGYVARTGISHLNSVK